MINYIYKIDDFILSEKDFIEFKDKLIIDKASEISSNFSYGENSYDGTEVHYDAVDKKTGEKYQYSEYEVAGGKAKTFQITKSEVSTSTKRPDALVGNWLLGKWVAIDKNTNGEILGQDIEFTDKDGKKTYTMQHENKIVESGSWEYNEYPNISLINNNSKQKFRIDFTTPEGTMVANYVIDGPQPVGEFATGYYKKDK